MNGKRNLIYDIEILRAIPPKNDADRIPGIEYCAGWHDHENMGITVIGAIEDGLEHTRPRVFLADNFRAFFDQAATADCLIGFNNINFDDRVLMIEAARHGAAEAFARVPRYDLLRETWAACGLGQDFVKETHSGYGLDDLARLNFGLNKTGNGALAPVLWQQGRHGEVIDYCLNDVRLTSLLWDLADTQAPVIAPGGRHVELRAP